MNLKQFREQTKDLPDSTRLWISIDEEGNDYKPVTEVQACCMLLSSLDTERLAQPAILLWPGDGGGCWGPV